MQLLYQIICTFSNIFLNPQLKITAISGVNLDCDKYDKNFGKWPFLPAA